MRSKVQKKSLNILQNISKIQTIVCTKENKIKVVKSKAAEKAVFGIRRTRVIQRRIGI